MRASWLLAFAIAASAALACGKKSPPPAPIEPAAASARALPSTLPTSVPVADLVGAKTCAECHQKIYDSWARSPHGRSMTKASPSTVIGDFTRTVTLPDGTVTLSQDAGGYYMDIQSGPHRERRKVDLVLASGRQHQLYVVETPDGQTLLPIVWSTKKKDWLPLSLYQPSDLSPSSRAYWASKDMTRGCFSCHLSQMYRRIDGGEPRTQWVDLSVNCESCHGPGREHVERRRAGNTEEVYRKLQSLGTDEEARVCGPCHGFQLKPYVFPAINGVPDVFVTSLIMETLRPDGTQKLTSYQYPGHALSGGYRLKVMVCNSCHEPHALSARDKDGASAEGIQSNRQCTVCHPGMASEKVASQHSHHSAKVRCVDCHMSMSWIGDTETRHQRTADHSISIPRPRESIELGTPNACTTCHKDKAAPWALLALEKWKQREATQIRDWVQTIALGRKMSPGATARLVALLTDKNSVPYLKASALDLLVLQTADASLVPVLEPFASDPDPNLRAIAVRALDKHDAQGHAKWRALGFSDAHPFVRMETFSMVRDVEALPADAIAKNVEDTLAFMSPPADGLLHLIAVRHKRHELREELALIDLLLRVATPREKRQMNLDALRARTIGELGPSHGP